MFCINQTHARIQGIKQVKKQIETGYVPGEGGKLLPDQSEIVKTIDEHGNLLQETNTRVWPEQNRTMTYRRDYFYNSAHVLDSCLIFNDEKYQMKLEYKYNSSGNAVEIQEYNSDRGKGFLTKNSFDASGNKIREELYTKENQLYNFKVYKYDKQNNLLDESGTEQGTKRYHWTYTYDKNNLLKERKDFSGQEQLLRRHTYEYDKEKRLVRENIFSTTGNLERVVKIRYEFY